ncbi:MAG: aminotransferase class I/II-fold pyridoxal phosphate-dependent enzyme, partial [Nitrospirae bacterium]|nr:aminotransferase class I/II-fold pyridoxal phosphate-dependent enzyme [Nitrospirota bacterium]
SKAHGLAGARMGYLIADAKVIERIARVRPMHEVTSITALAATWLLDHPEILKDYQQMVRAGKELLKNACALLGIGYRETPANYVLLKFPDPVATCDFLFKEKILVKKPYAYGPMKDYCRVCISDLNDMKHLVEALRKKFELQQG